MRKVLLAGAALVALSLPTLSAELPKCNDDAAIIELRNVYKDIDSLEKAKIAEGPRVPNKRQCRAFVTVLNANPRSFWVTYDYEWNGTKRPDIWLTWWGWAQLPVDKLPPWPSERKPELDNRIVEPMTCRSTGQAFVFASTSPNSQQLGTFDGDRRISTTGIARSGWQEIVFGRSDTKGWVHGSQLKDCSEN
jgi:hypothetical protein